MNFSSFTVWVIDNALWIMGVITVGNALIYRHTIKKDAFLTAKNRATLLFGMFIAPLSMLLLGALFSLFFASLAVFVDCHPWFSWTGFKCTTFKSLTLNNFMLVFKCSTLFIIAECIVLLYWPALVVVLKKFKRLL